MHPRNTTTGKQIGNRDRPHRALTDIVVYQFLQQATKDNLLDNG